MYVKKYFFSRGILYVCIVIVFENGSIKYNN